MQYINILNFILNENKGKEIVIIKEKRENEQYELLYNIIIEKFKNLTIFSPNDILQIQKNNQKQYFIILLSLWNKKLVKNLENLGYKEFDDYFYPRKIHFEGIKGNASINKLLGNEIIGDPDEAEIYFLGTNSKISFGKKFLAHKLKIYIRSNCKIQIGEDTLINRSNGNIDSHWRFEDNSNIKINASFWKGGELVVGQNAKIEIKNGTSISSNYNISIADNCTLKIGKNCMISYDIMILAGDGHPIFNIKNNKKINNKKTNITIGDHVWIGLRCTILSGAIIHNGSIIGANSFINKEIPPNCIAAGYPAKIIKENIYWKE